MPKIRLLPTKVVRANMSWLTTFNNLVFSLRDSLQSRLRARVCPESFLFKQIIKPEEPEVWSGFSGFQAGIYHLNNLVSKHGSSSPEVISALKKHRALFPNPHVEIVGNDIWDYHCVSVRTHLKSTFADAVSNIEATCRILSPDDKKFLKSFTLTLVVGLQRIEIE